MMKYKYIKRNEVKKKLSYICRSRGVSLQTKADMFRAIDNLPYTVESEFENTIGSDWISCEERMPEDNTTVLYVWRSENGNVSVFHGWHSSIRGLGGAWHQSGVGMQRPEDEVTHWMPLPEPPKE